MTVNLVAILCVLGISAGQILFKSSALSLSETGSYFAAKTASLIFSAFLLYGVTTLAWIWVLQRADLGRIYPLMALAFVIVPLASRFCFGERFSTAYFVGIALIATGIVFTVRS